MRENIKSDSEKRRHYYLTHSMNFFTLLESGVELLQQLEADL